MSLLPPKSKHSALNVQTIALKGQQAQKELAELVRLFPLYFVWELVGISVSVLLKRRAAHPCCKIHFFEPKVKHVCQTEIIFIYSTAPHNDIANIYYHWPWPQGAQWKNGVWRHVLFSSQKVYFTAWMECWDLTALREYTFRSSEQLSFSWVVTWFGLRAHIHSPRAEVDLTV